MLKYYMFKKISILVYCVVFIPVLYSNEPLLAFFDNSSSNDTQTYSVDGYNFSCSAYGVVTLERLYENATENSVCRDEIDTFYKKHPKSRYYIQSLLKYKQLYHLEIKGSKCVVYLGSQNSISELLLSKGLAILKPLFNDEEFKGGFSMAQKRAKIEKRGLWSKNIYKDCIKELSK